MNLLRRKKSRRLHRLRKLGRQEPLALPRFPDRKAPNPYVNSLYRRARREVSGLPGPKLAAFALTCGNLFSLVESNISTDECVTLLSDWKTVSRLVRRRGSPWKRRSEERRV